jgi:hypothetical protein
MGKVFDAFKHLLIEDDNEDKKEDQKEEKDKLEQKSDDKIIENISVSCIQQFQKW